MIAFDPRSSVNTAITAITAITANPHTHSSRGLHRYIGTRCPTISQLDGRRLEHSTSHPNDYATKVEHLRAPIAVTNGLLRAIDSRHSAAAE